MPIVSVRIPQMGEGLQEALLVEFIKKPGDMVRRDEAIYIMETDKANTEVESPYSGRLIEWTVSEGTVLAIGTEVAKMEVSEEVASQVGSGQGHGHGQSQAPSAPSQPASTASSTASSATSNHSETSRSPDDEEEGGSGAGGVMIPPRTRKYLKEKGVWSVAHRIPAAGSKLMPEDVDRYLASQDASHANSSVVNATASEASPTIASSQVTASGAGGGYQDQPVPKQQATLNYRLVRGVQSSVPVSIMIEVDWTRLEQARKLVKSRGGQETAFAMMLWCVVDTLKKHPKFRTTLVEDGKTFRTFEQVNMGIAVALPGDALVTAVVHQASKLDRSAFFAKVQEQIEKARDGVDQADASTTISVSNIGSAGIRWGIPAVVPPAVATLALGEVFDQVMARGTGFEVQRRAQLTLAFDHRVLNGVGAANFMNDLKAAIESYSV